MLHGISRVGALLSLLLIYKSAGAQTDPAPAPVTAQQVQALLEQLASQEARIRQLEAKVQQLSGPTLVAAAAPDAIPVPAVVAPATILADAAPVAAPQEPAPEEETHDHMMEVPHGPVLHFRGFFDFDFDKGTVAQQLQYPIGVPGTTTFRAGEFDLFMTSQLSENLSFLSELVLATDPTNAFGLDIERFQLTYRPTKYFEISGGRFHTDIGFYNTAFHHGTWFSTATGRPFMYYFEDAGGMLPVHEVGVTTTGLIPGTGKMNLHWTAEVGNGSAEFGTPLFGDGVENFVSDRNRKDVNIAFYSKPEWADGLQFGGSYLTGDLIPANTNLKVNQEISSAYVVFINSKWEFMNEIVLLQHQITDGGRSFNSPMGYTQLAYRFGKYRPYFRWQEVNIPNNDPVTAFKGRYEGPSVGMRVDFFSYAAFKVQYNRVYLRNAEAQNGIELQTAFTF